ncbi:hypothetical protein [Streptomyces violascens]|uniref:hypothetical protein n=1 Tax=Streptomyces violascens TaxID=67381 RepID=UPI001CFF0C68|nr:hypothetical protein [Streptomyces violascens]
MPTAGIAPPRQRTAPHRREKRQADGIGGAVRSGDGSFPAARLGSVSASMSAGVRGTVPGGR